MPYMKKSLRPFFIVHSSFFILNDETLLARTAQRLPPSALRRGAAVGQVVEADRPAQPTKLHQLDLAGVARLETHGQPGGDIQAHAQRRRTVEDQRAVDLKEMKMRANLDRPVAG